MVSALRRIRSELGVSPTRQVALLVQGGGEVECKRMGRFDSQLRFLNKLASIDVLTGEPPAAAAALVGEMKLFVPLEGLVDLDAERARLDKEIKRVDGEIAKSKNKLASDTFVQNAPAAVVEQERQRLADWGAQREALAAQRARIG
jgi:valyl-tRNA synthetase